MKKKIAGRKAFSESEKELIRKKIIDSAKKLFSEIDSNKVTMQKIAQKANIAKGTIYYYFKNMNDLYFVMSTEIFNNSYDAIENNCKNMTSNRDKFIEYNRSKYNYYKENITDFKISNKMYDKLNTFNTDDLPDSTLEKFNEVLRRGHSLFNNIIIDGVKNGEFRKELDVYQIMAEYAYGSRGILNFILLNYVKWKLKTPDEFFENYIFNYLRILEK